MNYRTLSSGFAAVLVAIMLVASVTGPVAAAELHSGAQNEVNTNADAAHNPWISANVTKSTHQMGWAADEYEGDQGDVKQLPAQINDTYDNSFWVNFTDIEASAYGEFPRDTQTESDGNPGAVRQNGWAEDESGTAGSGTISNVTTAPDVEAVEISTSSQTAGDEYNASFDAFKVTSDAEKRYVQLVLDVSTLDAAANVYIRFKDTDGDYVEAEIDADDNYNAKGVIANSTGYGFVFQEQVGSMTVSGSGDGSMGNINETKVIVAEANAEIEIAAANVEKTSPWTLGEQRVDSDGDGDLETETLTDVNESGYVKLRSLSSMDPIFDSATLHELKIPMEFHSSMYDQPSDYERFNFSAENASAYPNFDQRVDDYRRLYLPDAYDLSYADATLYDTVAVPDNRYQTVEYATAVGETNFTDIGWTDATSSYSTVDAKVQLATGLSAGQPMAVHYDYLVTSDEYMALTSSEATSSGGGAPMDDGEEGFFESFWNRLMTGITGLLVALGLRRQGGS